MMRSAIDEELSPKYAAFERERRWLIDPTLRPSLADLPYVLIEDRYLTDTRLRLRRMTDSVSRAQSLKLTKKYEADDPLARPIVTAYLAKAEYDVIAALAARTLVKRRYAVPTASGIFSIDTFVGDLTGLELAEIEWPDDPGLRALTPPAWAIREVSADVRYQGGSLVVHGIPED
jgi:CYTH domain-containing protein